MAIDQALKQQLINRGMVDKLRELQQAQPKSIFSYFPEALTQAIEQRKIFPKPIREPLATATKYIAPNKNELAQRWIKKGRSPEEAQQLAEGEYLAHMIPMAAMENITKRGFNIGLKILKNKRITTQATNKARSLLNQLKKVKDPKVANKITGELTKLGGELKKLRPRTSFALDKPTKPVAKPQQVLPKLPPKPPTKPPVQTPVEGTSVKKLSNLIKEAKPLRGKLSAQQTAERGKRIVEVERIIDNVGGEEGYRMALSKLKGKLVDTKKQAFEPLRNKLSQVEIDDVFNTINRHQYLDEWDKINASNGLAELLTGELPKPNQLVLLEEVFGTEFVKNILSKRSLGAKVGETIVDIANIPRALLATADMSAFLRQGVVYSVAHPVKAIKAMGSTFKFAFSPKAFKQYFNDLPKDPMYKLIRKSKLAITDPTRISGRLSEREEAFISRLIQKVPIIGQVTQFAERAYVGYLNKLRVDVFKQFADEFISKGYSPTKNPEIFKSAANMVNVFTGRGSLGGQINKITAGLNTIFFSPRLIAARFQALNPVWYGKMPAPVRKKAITDFAKFVGVGLTTLGLAKSAGADVETDPRSSDFGKIKIGNTRWDIWGGYQQWARAIAQITSGQRKNTTTGEIVSLTKDEYPYTTRKDTLLRFIESKLSPAAGLTSELMGGGKTYFGEDVTMEYALKEKLIPLYIQDIADAYAEGGLGRSISAGVPAFFGIGVQSYEPKAKGGTFDVGGLPKLPKLPKLKSGLK